MFRFVVMVGLWVVMGAALGNAFDDCILEHVRGVSDPAAVRAIRESCLKTVLPKVPPKCVGSGDTTTLERQFPVLESLFYQMCLDDCARASWWSRHFGDCRP